MRSWRCGLVPVFLLLAACATDPVQIRQPVSALYCDNFLIYEMCAQDLDRDGIVELIYFADTFEVFLWRDGAEERLPDSLTMHRCAQQMDADVIGTSSELFFISDETNYIQRADIKSALMFSYVAYMPRVMSCNAEFVDQTEVPVGDEFDF